MPLDDNDLQGMMNPSPNLIPAPQPPKIPAPIPYSGRRRSGSVLPPLPQLAPLPNPLGPDDQDEPEPEGRDFTDVDSTRRNIFDYSLKALQEMEPVETSTHILRIKDPAYVDPDHYSLAEEKKAITEGRDLVRRIRGTWVLEDKATGQALSERPTTLVRLPYLTHRGTYIRRGINYAPANQFRLLPGAYTRRKESGEIESHINVKAGTGITHRLMLEPEKGVFKIQLGTSSVPLLPVLKALGINDKQIKEAWGNDLTSVNGPYDTLANVRKLHTKLVGKRSKAKTDSEMQQELRDAFGKMQLNEFVTNKTLGKPYPAVSGEALLAATSKMLAVSRGETDVDNRDSYAFRELLGPEDLISERFRKSRKYLMPLIWKAAQRKSLDRMPPGALDALLDDVLQDGALTQGLEEINIIDSLDQQTRATQLGIGGIGNPDAVPDECYDAATEVFTSSGWISWEDATVDTQFACLLDGRLAYCLPQRLYSHDYSGEMYGLRTRTLDYLVTPGHRLWSRKYRGNSSVSRCGIASWGYELASDSHNKPREFLITHQPYEGNAAATYSPPLPPGSRTAYEFDFGDWAELVGWYIAEGQTDSYALREKGTYMMTITQTNEANPHKVARISALLARMGIPFSYQIKNFVFSGKQLGKWLASAGTGALNKRIPEECFTWPAAARRRLMESLVWGDGSTKPNTSFAFGSGSPGLMQDFSRLCTTLGYAVRERKPDTRRCTAYLRGRPIRKTNDYFTCGVLLSKVQGVTSERMYRTAYYRTDYSGKIYCAEVPGGLLLVRRNKSVPMWSGNSRSVQSSQMGFVDPLRTPERSNVGVDTRLAVNSRKGTDGKLYTRMKDAKTGRTLWRTPQDAADMVVAFPREMEGKEDYVAALVNGELDYVHRDKVDAYIPHFEKTFNPLSNLIPGKAGIKPQRALMGARMYAQALPLVDPEAPLVQSAVPDEDDLSYEEKYGEKMGAVRTKTLGEVVKVEPDGIHVRQADGSVKVHDLYNGFPLNRKSQIQNTPTVAVGDMVQPGQLLAYSNATDKNGATALGKNVRVALMASGENYEDGWTISESLAKKMSSQTLYQHDFEPDKLAKQAKMDFLGLFPKKFQPEALAKLDDNGIVKVGEKVTYGEPLLLSAVPSEITRDSVNRGKKAAFTDRSMVWEHKAPGTIKEVVKTKNGFNIIVEAINPSEVGDKLVTRFGSKGVLAEIREDAKMPHDSEGRPFELLADPEGIISRGNPMLLYDFVLSKIAAKTGKPYKLKDFEDLGDLSLFVKSEMEKHGIKDKEDLRDPVTGNKIKGILTGSAYMLKLHHSAESKAQGRGFGAYTSEGAPAKTGGPEGSSKRWSMMDIYAVLAHQGTEVARDAGLIRGQVAPEYWQQVMLGQNPPDPEVPLVFRKTMAHLQGSGINVRRTADQRLHLTNMTDKDVDKMTEHRIIKNPETVKWNEEMEPISGGLFDQKITGGHGANNWARIELSEKLPSPIMEEPIKRVLGITTPMFKHILAGKENLYGKTGPEAIGHALERINIDQALASARRDMKSGKRGLRDKAIRRLEFLKAAKENGMHPRDWMISKVPVLPPVFRPVSKMQGSSGTLVADANHLYKELMEADANLIDMKRDIDDVGEERMALYDSLKAVTGLGDPVGAKNKERGVKGLLAQVFASSPKYGHMQYKLLGGTLDNVGRSVISPDSNLNLDQVGLPEDTAWMVYKPYIIRRLVRHGVNPQQAVTMATEKNAQGNRDPLARKFLMDELEARPVLVNRAPVLHKYGYLALKPVLTAGKTLRVSPLITKGLGADFDGNCAEGNVKIELELTPGLLYASSTGREFLAQLNEVSMRLLGSELVGFTQSLPNGATVRLVLPIKDFPRLGAGSKNRKGQLSYEVPTGVRVCSYDHDRASVCWSEVTGVTLDTGHACVEVETSRGKKVIVSDNESLCIYDGSTDTLVKAAPRDSIGKMLPVVRCDASYGEWGSFDLGWWYGVLLADGWVSDRVVGYSKNSRTLRERFVDVARTICENFTLQEYEELKGNRTDKFGDSCKVHLSGKDLPARVHSCYAERDHDGRAALLKKIPEDLLNGGSEECLWGLLSGLLDGDSTIAWNTTQKNPRFVAKFNTSSPHLRDGILRLCRKLGLRCNYTTTPAKGHSKESYVVFPSICDLKQLGGRIRLFDEKNSGMLREFLESSTGEKDSTDIVPISAELAAFVAKPLLKTEATLYSTLRVSTKTGCIGRYSAERVLAVVKECTHPHWARFKAVVLDRATHWETVKAVTDAGTHDVYDLIVPETKVFMIDNGMIIYDTMNFTVPASDKAVKQALNRMLPSKSLLSPSDFKSPMFSPSQQYLIGLWEGSSKIDKKRPTRVFRNTRDVAAALERGEIDHDTKIRVLEDPK